MRRPATVIPALLLGLALTSPATARAPTSFMLTASPAAAGDGVGRSVAVSDREGSGTTLAGPTGTVRKLAQVSCVQW